MIRTLFLTSLLSVVAVAEDSPLPDSERDLSVPRMPAEETAGKMQLPPGFKATVFAAEPEVRNPVAMTWDHRGRLWVAENYTYSERAVRFDLSLKDRVVIFSDKDGDGRSEERTVFPVEFQALTSIEVGHGGVWALCPPKLLFIPDGDRDDRPDGPAVTVLDGFTVPQENYHNFANGLRWGPDGWLYGRCGASAPALVGAPGATDAERVPVAGGMWRYHPGRRFFENICHGTTNPWGHDWDKHGELFFINTVNGHLWHGIAGAHFVRPHTVDSHPGAYGLIDQHADHFHFDTGAGWMASRDGKANALGGGHAHCGLLIYQGQNWPAEFRDRLFTLNFHGRRVNAEQLERQGSGYVGRHLPDFGLVSDPWFRGIDLRTGPDGGVFVLDYSDTGECHEHTGIHRNSGRIYKIAFGENPAPLAPFDLAAQSPAQLAALRKHPGDWWQRQSRLALAEIASAPKQRRTSVSEAAAAIDMEQAQVELRAALGQKTSDASLLRALWALHAVGGASDELLYSLLDHPSEHLRAWAVRLLTDDWPLDGPAGPLKGREAVTRAGLSEKLFQLAQRDESGLVRLVLASTLQRLPVEQRHLIAAPLMARAADADDHNLPLMIWYGVSPVAARHLSDLLPKCELPVTRRCIARRLAESVERLPEPLSLVLEYVRTAPEAAQLDVLTGISEALRGWRKAPRPRGWEQLAAITAKSANPTLASLTQSLSAVFGDGVALDELRRIALDQSAGFDTRKRALEAIITSDGSNARELCEKLISVRFVNPTAARGLAAFADEKAAATMIGAYRAFHPTERPGLLATLVSRPVFAHALLKALSDGKIPREDVTAFHARQIVSLNDPTLRPHLTEAWGQLQESDIFTRKHRAEIKEQLELTLPKANLPAGRALFQTLCGTCHKLYGEGSDIGPDLTGSGRANLDYLLEAIGDPGAVVTADFRLTTIELKDGRTLSGLLRQPTEKTVTVVSLGGSETVQRDQVAKQVTSNQSLMPAGMLDALDANQRRDLIGYLMHPTQVELPVKK